MLYYEWKKYGSGKISWSQLLKPDIELAENGFAVGQFRGDVYLLRNGINSYYGGVLVIALQQAKWIGAADLRRDGTVGYSKN